VSGPRPLPDDLYPVISSTPVFTGRVISLRTDEVRMTDGSVSRREVVHHPGAVGVVALDDDENIVLVNQFRHPVRAFLDELPAGLLDVEGESALDGAKRELFEEAGLRAGRWDVLIDLYTSPGMTDEAIRIYLARELRPAEGEAFTPEHEEIIMTVTRIPLDDAVARVWRGEVTNAAAVAGIMAAWAGRATGWAGLRDAHSPWPARPGR
jgi:ADP-ribose pyrophosphatase